MLGRPPIVVNDNVIFYWTMTSLLLFPATTHTTPVLESNYFSFRKFSIMILMVAVRFSAYLRNKDFCEPSHTTLLSLDRLIFTIIG